MGLFGGKKIYVASTVYSLAGDIAERPNFLKTVVAGKSITESSKSKAEIIRESYSMGPGIRMRNFYRWALDNYDQIGVPRGSLASAIRVSPDLVADQLPKPAGSSALVQSVEVDIADFSYWAEQWIFENEPQLIDTDWTADYDDATNEVVITFEDATTERFTPAGFDKTARYLYAVYSLSLGRQEGPVVPGAKIVLAEADSFPGTSGWSRIENTSIDTHEKLKRVVTTTVSYSDGRPNEVTENVTYTEELYNRLHAIYVRNEYQGADDTIQTDRLLSLKKTMTLDLVGSISTEGSDAAPVTEDIGSGVIKTTNVHTDQQVLTTERSYQVDTQDIVLSEYTGAKLFIYRIGSGNAELDAIVNQVEAEPGEEDGYLPFIPLRLDNKFLSATYQPEAYELAKKAYKKSMSGKIEDIIGQLANNENLKDIDYAYVAFGVPLNTKDRSCKKYLYQFFQRLMNSHQTDSGAYSTWETSQESAQSKLNSWMSWRTAQTDPVNPLYNTKEPVTGDVSGPPLTEVRIKNTGPLPSNFDTRLYWRKIVENRGVGLAKPDAQVGDIWIEYGPATSTSDKYLISVMKIVNADKLIERGDIRIRWQVSANSWKEIAVTGLIHQNFIYKGKLVTITAREALEDADESGFLVPIHYDLFREMSLVDSTQIATQCAYLVLNSYKVVKQKWYQTGIFKIITFIIIVVLIVFVPQLGLPAASILGSSAAVGAALGLSGLIALIVGTAVNMLAAMIVMKILSIAAIAVLGKKWGAIFAAVASFVALSVGSAMAGGMTFVSALNSMMTATNLIALTSAVGQGITGLINANIQELGVKTNNLLEDYKDESKRIENLFAENIGYDRGFFNPLDLIDAPGPFAESRESFLQRTLMTGSDIADISMNLISDFTELTLRTDLLL